MSYFIEQIKKKIKNLDSVYFWGILCRKTQYLDNKTDFSKLNISILLMDISLYDPVFLVLLLQEIEMFEEVLQ